MTDSKSRPAAPARPAATQAGAQAQPRATLTAYVEPGCKSCGNTLELVERVRRELPAVQVQVVDVSKEPEAARPDDVFAVPTLVLNGRIISLGTPTWAGLSPLLQAALAE